MVNHQKWRFNHLNHQKWRFNSLIILKWRLLRGNYPSIHDMSRSKWHNYSGLTPWSKNKLYGDVAVILFSFIQIYESLSEHGHAWTIMKRTSEVLATHAHDRTQNEWGWISYTSSAGMKRARRCPRDIYMSCWRDPAVLSRNNPSIVGFKKRLSSIYG
jgi:hypothetical protein